MLILWDERKREINLRVHGIDFADLRHGFDFVTTTFVTSYGGRYATTGYLDGRLITVVVSFLGSEALSVVSARPASSRERKLHGQR